MATAILAAVSSCDRDLLHDVNDGPALRRAVSGFAAPGMSLDSARARLEHEDFVCEPEPAAGARGIRCEHEGVRDDAAWRWAVTLRADGDRIDGIGTFVSRSNARRRVLP